MVACDEHAQARLSAPGRTPIDLLGTVALGTFAEAKPSGVTSIQIPTLTFGDGFVLAECQGEGFSGVSSVVFVVPGNPLD
jgi:hypothetical protein